MGQQGGVDKRGKSKVGINGGYCTRTKDKIVKRANKRGIKHALKQELRREIQK